MSEGKTVLAEFRSADRLLEAIRRTRQAGYHGLDAFAPFPVEGLHEALGRRPTRARVVMLVAAVALMVIGFGIQWLSAVYLYPFNAGGRPFNSWQVFVIAPYYVAILAATVAGILVLIVRGGLLEFHHPLFEVEGFERVTTDRFFLSVADAQSEADRHQLHNLLVGLDALSIREVEL